MSGSRGWWASKSPQDQRMYFTTVGVLILLAPAIAIGNALADNWFVQTVIAVLVAAVGGVLLGLLIRLLQRRGVVKSG